MADYYPLIARAVAGLEKNTGDARRALYERARTALVAQLRSVNPPLSENDVTRERLALEESIRKVEAEAARRAWSDPAQTATATRIRSPEFPRWNPPPPSAEEPPPDATPPAPSRADGAVARPAGNARLDGSATRMEGANKTTARALRSSSFASAAPPPAAPPPPAGMLGEQRYVDPVFDQPLPSDPAPDMPRVVRPRTGVNDRRTLTDDGLKDFRHVVPESDELGEAPIRASRSARDNYAAIAPASHDYDRIDARSLDPNAPPLPEYPAPALLEQDHVYDEPKPYSARGRAGAAIERRTSRSSLASFVRMAVTFLVLAGLGGLVVWLWPSMSELYSRMRAPPPSTEVASDTAPTTTRTPRINDRFEQGAPSTKSTPSIAPAPSGDGASVGQKVVLYEEDPSDPQGKRFVGTAVWRTERVPPSQGQPGEVLIRADVAIPDRKLIMTWSLKRETDQTLQTSHTIELVFRASADFPTVDQVPGILMKSSEQTRGVPLAGAAVKVTNGYFLIGLSAVGGDRERNLQMLRERAWFDIPIVYNNNRRAILAVEKGTPGERVFAEAFAAWQQ